MICPGGKGQAALATYGRNFRLSKKRVQQVALSVPDIFRQNILVTAYVMMTGAPRAHVQPVCGAARHVRSTGMQEHEFFLCTLSKCAQLD